MNDFLNQELSEGDFVILPSKGNFELTLAKIIEFDSPKVRVIWKHKYLRDPTTAQIYPEYLCKIDKTILSSEVIEELTLAAKMLL